MIAADTANFAGKNKSWPQPGSELPEPSSLPNDSAQALLGFQPATVLRGADRHLVIEL